MYHDETRRAPRFAKDTGAGLPALNSRSHEKDTIYLNAGHSLILDTVYHFY
jgi:hypothetical protein